MNPISDRINLYGAGWRMFLEKPIFGFGFNTFMKHSPNYVQKIKGIPYRGWESELSSHDKLFGFLAELGIVSASLIVFIVFNILQMSVRLYRKL